MAKMYRNRWTISLALFIAGLIAMWIGLFMAYDLAGSDLGDSTQVSVGRPRAIILAGQLLWAASFISFLWWLITTLRNNGKK